MNIGQAAQDSGISAKTIRYYENTGLIPAAIRTGSGYRSFSAKDVHTLRFIHRARRLGFSVHDIRQLLTLLQDKNRASADVKALALAHMTVLDRKLAELQTMQRTLQHLIAHCEGDERPDCPILDDLAGDGAERLRDEPGSPLH
ncbi:Cu(I)-responsive transcriptional regulator [Chelativorans alearense]|uniref:Cu(I)-responsive transcriptional regulator n=1 Tax=Chelativorans alearense TaxID=2681495 RepID=UPI0013D789BA|nr:Cu(I)-responsive transcriptional regulator [Chelativorans alearense]